MTHGVGLVEKNHFTWQDYTGSSHFFFRGGPDLFYSYTAINTIFAYNALTVETFFYSLLYSLFRP